MFDPRPYLVNLSRSGPPRWYLQARGRLAWMQSEHPDWRLHSEIVQIGTTQAGFWAIVKVSLWDGTGQFVAEAHAMATTVDAPQGRAVEKAETSAMGRALAIAGYTTQAALSLPAPVPPGQAADDLDEDDYYLADAPVAPVETDAPAAETGALRRQPLAPIQLRDAIQRKTDTYAGADGTSPAASWRKKVAARLVNDALSALGLGDDRDRRRHSITDFLFASAGVSALTNAEAAAMIAWLTGGKRGYGALDPVAVHELKNIVDILSDTAE